MNKQTPDENPDWNPDGDNPCFSTLSSYGESYRKIQFMVILYGPYAMRTF